MEIFDFERLAIFGGVLLIFLLELGIPRRAYHWFSIQRKEDLIWMGLNQVLYPFLMTFISFNLGIFISSKIAGVSTFFVLTESHILIQILVYALTTDLASYFIHRGFHTFGPFWDMHRMHHSTTELTVLSSFRHTWVEFLILSSMIGVGSGIFTVDNNVRLWVNIVFSYACIIQHSNVKFPYPAFLEYLVITPRNHFWHHSKEMHTKSGQNFGFIFPYWDMIFKTHYNPDNYNTDLGLHDEFEYTGPLDKFFYPFDKWFGLRK